MIRRKELVSCLPRLRAGWIMLLSLTAFTIGSIFTAIAPVHQTYWGLNFVCLLTIPWGMDMSFPAATLMLSNASKKGTSGNCRIARYCLDSLLFRKYHR
jgi:hypothetical protein